MSDMLIRGVSGRLRRLIARLATSQNLSINQKTLRLLEDAVKREQGQDEEDEERANVFRKIEKLREELRAKYGKQEDSVKLIRQMRDERSRKLG